MSLSLLTVCLGNICRSPTAEAAILEAAEAAGLEVSVESAGTGAWHVGNPPDRRMQAAGRAAELHIDGTAQRVDADAIAEADLVLAMDRSNLADLQRLAADHDLDTPIVLFRDFDPEVDGGAEVPDPYYGGEDGFVEVVEICRRSAAELLAGLGEGGVDAALTRAGTASS